MIWLMGGYAGLNPGSVWKGGGFKNQRGPIGVIFAIDKVKDTSGIVEYFRCVEIQG